MDNIGYFSYWYNLVMTYLLYGFTWLSDNFREFADVIKVAAISLTASLAVILFSMIRVAYNSWKERKYKKVVDRLDKRYGEGIKYILSSECPNNMSRDQVLEALDLHDSDIDRKKLLKDWRERMAMSQIIYKYRISEEAALNRRRNLSILLGVFGIKEFLEEVIVKDKIHHKTDALHMLRAFKVPTNQWIANQLMNSRRKRVQRLAMYASIMSSTNADLEYFESDFFDANRCIYDEIQLGYVLHRRQSMKRKIPNLAHWAHMHNTPETQCVFVRLMRQFNQKEYCADLEPLFNHNSPSELIEEIARTWGYLKYVDGEAAMSDMLLTQPDDGKVSIMHALTRLGTGNSMSALLDGYRNSGNQHVKFEALRCIYWYGQAGREKFMELKESALPADKPLFEFFENKLTIPDLPLEKDDVYRSEYGDNLYSVI